MGDVFSSPTKQGQQVGGAVQGMSNQEISQLENYVNTGEGQQRAAIAGMGANPFFAAAGGQNPSSYALSPGNTTNFGSSSSGAPVVHAGSVQSFTPSTPTMSNPFSLASQQAAQNAAAAQAPPAAAAAAPAPAVGANAPYVGPSSANPANTGSSS